MIPTALVIAGTLRKRWRSSGSTYRLNLARDESTSVSPSTDMPRRVTSRHGRPPNGFFCQSSPTLN